METTNVILIYSSKNNGGIVVNSSFEAIGGLYVASNLASYYDPAVGRRRVDMFDHAVNSGRIAGINMASQVDEGPMLYNHQPSFQSKIPAIGISCHGVGIINSSLATVGVWQSEDAPTPATKAQPTQDNDGKTDDSTARPTESVPAVPVEPSATADVPLDFNKSGAVYYLKGEQIVGIVVWNAKDTEQIKRAQSVINSKRMIEDISELKSLIQIAPVEKLTVILQNNDAD